MITLTVEQLKALEPCNLDERLVMFGKRKSMNAKQAFAAGASIGDLCWIAGRLGRRDLLVRFALKCAQSTAHLNTDPRVQTALDATQAWLDNPCKETRKAASAAASAAARAAAYAAARAAAYAARAAYAAAYATADAAARAADAAAYAAAYAAADAADAAARAAARAADAAETEKQKAWFVEIFS